jgi:hypothetical protein
VFFQNSQGHWPNGVLDHVTVIFYKFLIPVSLINGAGLGACSLEGRPLGDRWASVTQSLGGSWLEFSRFLGAPERHQKTTIFRHHPKTSQNTESIAQGPLNFEPNLKTFGLPFCIDFRFLLKIAKV